MNNIGLLIISIIYFVSSINLFKEDNYGLALTFICYGLSNLCLILAAKGV